MKIVRLVSVVAAEIYRRVKLKKRRKRDFVSFIIEENASKILFLNSAKRVQTMKVRELRIKIFMIFIYDS